MAKQVLHSENLRVDFSDFVTASQFADEYFHDAQCRHDFWRSMYRQFFINCIMEFGRTQFAVDLLGNNLDGFLYEVCALFSTDFHKGTIVYHLYTSRLEIRASDRPSTKMASIFRLLSDSAKKFANSCSEEAVVVFDDLPF